MLDIFVSSNAVVIQTLQLSFYYVPTIAINVLASEYKFRKDDNGQSICNLS